MGHCQRTYGWDVAMPAREARPSTNEATKKLVAELRKLTKQVAREGLESADTKVLEKIVAKSLAFRIGDIARAANEQFVEDAGKRYFHSGDEVVHIPAELDDYFTEYMRRRRFSRAARKSGIVSRVDETIISSKNQ